jgi:hypothetical protein
MGSSSSDTLTPLAFCVTLSAPYDRSQFQATKTNIDPAPHPHIQGALIREAKIFGAKGNRAADNISRAQYVSHFQALKSQR